MNHAFVAAVAGFKVKYPEDTDWNDVVAWRVEENMPALPVTLWITYGVSAETFLVQTPDGKIIEVSE